MNWTLFRAGIATSEPHRGFRDKRGRSGKHGRFFNAMKIGNPIKLLVKISERRGKFIVSNDTMEISLPTLYSARRLGVVLRRAMDRSVR